MLYDFFYRTLFSRFGPEWIHDFSIQLLENAGNRRVTRAVLETLYTPKVTAPPIMAFGLEFAHPLGIAGGFDKNGRCLLGLQALGFSFIEVGTVTPRPQLGNPRPRLYRLSQDKALINRMGFPSEGMEAVARRLSRTRNIHCPVGISLGKNKTTPIANAADDYLAVLDTLYPYGDFFVVNVSSPNTPELRNLQNREHLSALLERLQSKLTELSRSGPAKPLLVKVSPDLTCAELDKLLDVALACNVSGIVATNTTVERPVSASRSSEQPGGLSGKPLQARSTEIVRYIRQQVGDRLAIIGVGGVFNGDSLREKLDAGATLVQAYTGFIYQGPAFVRKTLNASGFCSKTPSSVPAADRQTPGRASPLPQSHRDP